MQSPDYNLKYAKSLSALASVLPTAEAQGPDAVLALLVKYTNFDFGSAAWFLTTQCEPDVVSGLAAGTVAAYEGYVAGCVRGSPSDKRTAYFTKGMAVLGGNTGN